MLSECTRRSTPRQVYTIFKSFKALKGVQHAPINRGVFSHPRVTKFRGWHPWKGDNSKFKISKIYRFWQTDSLHRGNWPCWVQIWHYFWARPTPSLSFWLFLSKTWKKSEKLVGQIVSQIRPCYAPRVIESVPCFMVFTWMWTKSCDYLANISFITAWLQTFIEPLNGVIAHIFRW